VEEKILILDFGGQYSQLIARRVRECGVYCEVKPYHLSIEAIRAFDPLGIILSGGGNSVYAPGAPRVDETVFQLQVPILGICYGCQLMAHMLGGEVVPAHTSAAREYGGATTYFDIRSPLFAGMSHESVTWMSHGDYLSRVPAGFTVTARSGVCPTAAIADKRRQFYGVQFHPEAGHTEHGTTILQNFLFRICGAQGLWAMEDYAPAAIDSIRRTVGNGRVLLALSGGVDSTVAAALIAEAVGRQLTCVFVDHGLMRFHEAEEIEATFAGREMRFIRVNAAERFLSRLAGVTDPETKRKIIGEEFIRVFEEEAEKLGQTEFLAQGTIYPDVIESGAENAELIKSHHNVGGLPKTLQFKHLIEPLRMLFKDEVRELGRELGLPEQMVNRQPFPGPGLAIRILGEVTPEKVTLLQQADAIFRNELAKSGDEVIVSQAFAVLLDSRSVGVMGDGRTYDSVVALRAVVSEDFMSAHWAQIPYEILERTAHRIVNEVQGVNRVVYDITDKPPATVEWE